ncbi:NAD(P)H-dependent oxidoreductase [Aquibacillus sp. 3ASR75-11]|uniref:NAD(P)H-dependent oxidoreductase n=1 Tax=Terrihalobacillus insolitus TaxID=2950438 RepID=A0A9X3WQP9_9BACI|nr:NAD(P)H-dependent oxidoreductase [Terrihalobacillus insolitus]MDC3415128.1 NAD(P)H-dependent oxidoreductase [Terrihalobacillus insolitus]MDC3424040.1 NAD(P)H-dependent oxidoreductase [Terrihalobacillus insolitus]
MKVVGLVGSIRKDSYNQYVANFIKNRYKEEMNLQFLSIKALPFFDQTIEEDQPTVVKDFKKTIKEADAVLIVTPEYNHSVPGILKNSIDWLSRVDRVMIGKPALIVGASTGLLGTVRCQMHLRQIFASPGIAAKVLPGNEVFIGRVQDKLDENGQLVDQPTIDFLDSVIKTFVKFIQDS